MIYYEVDFMWDHFDAEEKYRTSKADAVELAKDELAGASGSAEVRRIRTLDPSDVGGPKKWGLLLLNRRGFLRSSETVAKFKSEERRERETGDAFDVRRSYVVSEVSYE